MTTFLNALVAKMAAIKISSFNGTEVDDGDSFIPYALRLNPAAHAIQLGIACLSMWFIKLFGYIGNPLSLYVFTRPSFAKLSISRLFVALSLADFLNNCITTPITIWRCSDKGNYFGDLGVEVYWFRVRFLNVGTPMADLTI